MWIWARAQSTVGGVKYLRVRYPYLGKSNDWLAYGSVSDEVTGVRIPSKLSSLYNTSMYRFTYWLESRALRLVPY